MPPMPRGPTGVAFPVEPRGLWLRWSARPRRRSRPTAACHRESHRGRPGRGCRAGDHRRRHGRGVDPARRRAVGPGRRRAAGPGPHRGTGPGRRGGGRRDRLRPTARWPTWHRPPRARRHPGRPRGPRRSVAPTSGPASPTRTTGGATRSRPGSRGRPGRRTGRGAVDAGLGGAPAAACPRGPGQPPPRTVDRGGRHLLRAAGGGRFVVSSPADDAGVSSGVGGCGPSSRRSLIGPSLSLGGNSFARCHRRLWHACGAASTRLAACPRGTQETHR